MEISNIEKNKTIKIDTENGAVFLSYMIKMKISIKGKELEIMEKLWRQTPFDYDSDDAEQHLTRIEHEMFEMEKEAENIIEKVKESFINLEKILERYEYKVI